MNVISVLANAKLMCEKIAIFTLLRVRILIKEIDMRKVFLFTYNLLNINFIEPIADDIDTLKSWLYSHLI